MSNDEHAFDALIYRQGILRCVDVPADVADALADWRYPPVVLRVGGAERATTLMRRADGGLRAFLHDSLRRAAGVDTGESVHVEMTIDASPLEPLPDALIEAARHIDHGLEALELLPPGLRREMLRFVGEAKSAATLRKRLARCTELLQERAEKARSQGA